MIIAEITNWRTDTYASGDTMPPSQGMDMRDQILANLVGTWEFNYVNALNGMGVKPTRAVTGTNTKIGTLSYADGADAIETFQPPIAPAEFDSTADITIDIYYYANATSGAVIWGHSLVPVAASESIDPAQSFTDWDADTVPGVANTLKKVSKTLTAGEHGIQPGDLVYLAIRRNGGGADNLAAAAVIVNVVITWSKTG
jgi:hypothetical protein